MPSPTSNRKTGILGLVTQNCTFPSAQPPPARPTQHCCHHPHKPASKPCTPMLSAQSSPAPPHTVIATPLSYCLLGEA